MTKLLKVLKTTVIVLCSVLLSRYSVFGASLFLAMGLYLEWKEQIDGKDV